MQHFQGMPTAHPRHTITETPLVKEALDELRARLGGERIDYSELIVLGARMKTRQLPDDAKAAREAAQRLAERIRRRLLPVDVQAADEVKYRGLIADRPRGSRRAAPCKSDLRGPN